MKHDLKRALEMRRRAEREVELELAHAYPAECSLEWLVGKHRQRGTVVRHAGDRVRVYNHVTGRESWIYAGRIL